MSSVLTTRFCLPAFVLWVGCVAPPTLVEEEGSSVADLWANAVPTGAVIVGPVVVVSPRTATGHSFYVQDPGGGPGTGLRVDLGGFLGSLPPPVGTQILLNGSWFRELDAPVLVIDDESDLLDLKTAGTATASAWSIDDPTLVGSLISAHGVEVRSVADPSGYAETSAGFALNGRFGDRSPGRLSEGDLVGIAVETGNVAMRWTSDWSGTRTPDNPVDLTIAELLTQEEGTYARIAGVQTTPWGADGRWTAIQDGPTGLWIDTEAWEISESSEQGDKVTFVGEIRADPDGPRLRCWTPPTVEGTGSVVFSATPLDGSVLTLVVQDPSEPDVYGDRTTSDGWILDNRLGPLDAWLDGDTVTGVVRGSAQRLAVWPPSGP